MHTHNSTYRLVSFYTLELLRNIMFINSGGEHPNVDALYEEENSYLFENYRKQIPCFTPHKAFMHLNLIVNLIFYAVAC